MPDRNALADALMSATVEQLREDAEVFHRYASHSRHEGERARCFRLAALALAVAKMQDSAPHTPVCWSLGWYNACPPRPYDEPEPCTLTAALAALVREGA